jgi:hypothetical protein
MRVLSHQGEANMEQTAKKIVQEALRIIYFLTLYMMAYNIICTNVSLHALYYPNCSTYHSVIIIITESTVPCTLLTF